MTSRDNLSLLLRSLPFVFGGAACLLAVASILHLPQIFRPDGFHPGAPVFAIVNLLLALLAALAALVSRRRFKRGQTGPGKPGWILLALAVLTVWTPAFPLWINLTELPDGYLPGGTGIHKRSVQDILQQGWSSQSVEARTLNIQNRGMYSSHGEAVAKPCIAELRESRGFLAVSRHYSWYQPAQQLRGEKPDAALETCQTFRQELVQQHHGLESALLSSDSNTADFHRLFHANLATDGQLLLQWSDLPPSNRKLFQALLFNDERLRDVTLSLFDVALLLKDEALIRETLPFDGALPHQRYALYKLGLTDLLEPFPPARREAEQRVSFWNIVQIDPLSAENASLRGNYAPFDYALANLACDAEYAAFLADQGLTPETAMAHDLVNSLLLKDKRARPSRYQGLTQADFPEHKLSHSATGDCAALARFYNGHPDIVAGELAETQARQMAATLGDVTLRAYQALASEAMSSLPPEQQRDHHSPEADQIYASLVFTAEQYPIPDAMHAYVNLYAGHFNIGALCGTLAYSAWALSHPEITEEYRNLWRSWNGVLPDDIADRMDFACSIPLINPPNLYTAQTALRNELLELAGVPCKARLDTIEGWYVRSVLECEL